jgi:tetratricopeptide (TPR) repeat protein
MELTMNRFDRLELPSAALENPFQPAGAVRYEKEDHLRMAGEAWRRGDFERALRQYSKALGMDPDWEEAWLGQVRCLMDLDEVKEARLWVNKALERNPRSSGLWGAKSLVLARMMEDKASLECSDKAFSLKEYSWYLWFTRGCVLLKRGLKSSDYCFQKALEFTPPDWLVHLRIGMAYLEVADHHQALPYIRKAAQAEPNNPLVLLKYGLCCAKMGWRDQARGHFEGALRGKSELEKELREALEECQKWNPWGWAKGIFNRLLFKEA